MSRSRRSREHSSRRVKINVDEAIDVIEVNRMLVGVIETIEVIAVNGMICFN